MEENKEEEITEETELRGDINQDIIDEYGSPIPEEKTNQWSIFRNAIDANDNVKTTYLSKGELGRPLFSVRFYMNCLKIAEKYNAKEVESFFRNKIQNIASSGMSNEGFIMKLNVSSRKSIARKTQKSDSEEHKGETF